MKTNENLLILKLYIFEQKIYFLTTKKANFHAFFKFICNYLVNHFQAAQHHRFAKMF